MINIFKSKKLMAAAFNFPERVIFTQYVPFFGENIVMILNDGKTEYEAFAKIGFTDEIGKVTEKPMRWSLPMQMYFFPNFGLISEEEFSKRELNRTKISELKDLIKRIEKL